MASEPTVPVPAINMARVTLESGESSPKASKAKPCMQFDEGDVSISLGERNNLLLHANVLRRASTFFETGPKNEWTETASTFTDPKTGKRSKLYDYALVWHDDDQVFIIETNTSQMTRDDRDIRDRFTSTGIPFFYLSENADGFAERESDRYRRTTEDSGALHFTLFAMLYHADPDLSSITYDDIASMTAYAELYDILAFVAPQLRQRLLGMPGLWTDVRDNFMFHLALSFKLRCSEIYCDALKHFIGSTTPVRTLTSMLDFDHVYSARVADKREDLRAHTDKLTKDIQALTLDTYISHTDKDDHGPPARTTFRASGMDNKNAIDIARDIGRRIFSEWFNFQLCGQEHWSHVREYNSTYENGVFYQSSLRNACNIAVNAYQTGTELDVFDPDAAAAFAKEHDFRQASRPYIVQMIEDELKQLVAKMSSIALPYIAPPDFKPTLPCLVGDDAPKHPEDFRNRRGGRGGGRGRGPPPTTARHGERERPRYRSKKLFEYAAMTAKDDSNCHYFTCVDVDPETGLPWEEDFEAFRVQGAVKASREWLATVGLPQEEDEEQSESEDGDEDA